MRTRTIILASFLAGCTANAEPEHAPPQQTKAVDHEARAKALVAVKGEAKVKDAVWNGSTLAVGVVDDGSKRDGYASYICEVLREHGAADGVTVSIKDIVSIASGGSWKEIGKARC